MAVLAAPRRFAKGVALAAALAVTACSDAGLDALPSAGVFRVETVDEVGALRLADGRRVHLAGVEISDADALRRLAAGREVELLGDAEAEALQVRLRRGRWLQGALLEQGAVRVRTRKAERSLAGLMLRAESVARRKGRGAWADDWRVLTADEAVTARGFQIVEGRVVDVQTLRPGVFLDFGRDWRRDLSVRIPREALDDFTAAGRSPATLKARLVRVRGRLQPTRNGPLLILDHPEALELLREP